MAMHFIPPAASSANPRSHMSLPYSSIARLVVHIENRAGTASVIMDAPITVADRDAVAREIEGLIALLDAIDGDPDDQQSDGDEFDATGDEDAATLGVIGHYGSLPCEDDEDDDPLEGNGDEGDYSDGNYGIVPIYGIDQAGLPLSEAEASASYKAAPLGSFWPICR